MALIERQKPIAEQVRDLLKDRILAKKYAADTRLPSEEALARELAVSRATIRTALTLLAADGLIVRRQGSGTFVTKNVIELQTRFNGLWEFTRLIESSGRAPAIRVLKAEQRSALAWEADALHIKPGEPVLALERLFTADDQPVILSTNVLPVEIICTPYPPEATSLPIIRFFELYCQKQYAYAIADISAASASSALSRLFSMRAGTSLLRFDEVFYSQDDVPLVCATSYYNDKVLRLRVLRA
jgi:GntR family transcriptional regulator